MTGGWVAGNTTAQALKFKIQMHQIESQLSKQRAAATPETNCAAQ